MVSQILVTIVLQGFFENPLKENKLYLIVVYIILSVFSFYFNLKKDTGQIKGLTKYSFIIIAYIVILMSVQVLPYMREEERTYSPWPESFSNILKNYGCFIYSFNCIINVFIVKTTLYHSTKKRMGKIFRRTILFLFLFYSIMSLSGYLSFGDKVKEIGLILERPALNGSSDVLMKIGIAMIAF